MVQKNEQLQNRMSAPALGLLRMAAISPELRVADVRYNTAVIVAAMDEAAGRGCRLALFPELCLTGYTCGDLFYQTLLQQAAREALVEVAGATAENGLLAVVGLPLPVDGRIYNCAALVGAGDVLGIVPKSFLPTTNEFYEERWFTSGAHAPVTQLEIGGNRVPFGVDLLFSADNLPGCTIGIEICEDLWAVNPPSGAMALAGATLILNPSASNELLSKRDYRRDLIRQQSARCLAAYAYAGAGPGESTTDVVYSGHSMLAENGAVLAETARFQFETQMAIADIDLQRLGHERLLNSSFSSGAMERSFRSVPCRLANMDDPWPADDLIRPGLSTRPFVPANLERRAEHCREIFAIQTTGLAKRLRHVGSQRIAIGISGGLDSTLALLVTVRAFEQIGLAREGIVAVTMPGFGTTTRTRGNAEELAELLGVTVRVIPIHAAVAQHFDDIGHDPDLHNVTYENAQARERTQILMDIANQIGGIMVGTGDLSELALGWCTYNADHMSMYHVNAGVPKTLVRYLVEWCADSEYGGRTAEVLHDICATPITPELLPLGKDGALEQKTEDTIGPYDLHDFLLFYTVRYGFAPGKSFFLARRAFRDRLTAAEILRWMAVFYRRFFASQFKRSAMPDGPKVGSVALSPRGDWRMPSDASASLWLQEVDALEAELPA
jgi:NAD+ synthase (glutamine-hydrolysing)